MSGTKRSLEDIKNAISRQQGVMTDKPAMSPKNPADLVGADTSIIRLNVFDVEPFEGNPRTQINPEYVSILESIRDRGIDQALTVVAPLKQGEKYRLAKGGKTRLMALQELAKEDAARFEYHDFLIIQYKSESELLAAHLVENLTRADMSFWDTAQGLVKMHDMLIAESGRPLSKPEIRENLKSKGIVVDATLPNDATFAVEHYHFLGVLTQSLARDHIRNKLRPLFNQMQRIWLLSANSEAEFIAWHCAQLEDYATFETVLDVNKLCAILGDRLVAELGLNDHHFDDVVRVLERHTGIQNLDDLKSVLDEALESQQLGLSIAQTMDALADDEVPRGEDSNEDGDADDFGLNDLQANMGDYLQGKPSHLTSHLSDHSNFSKVDTMGFAGVEGLIVSDGSDLTILGKDGDGVRHGEDVHPGASETFAPQLQLPGLSPADVLIDALQSFIDFGDVSGLYVELDTMPRGFYMELPEDNEDNPLLADPIAAQVWWCMAELSGQMSAYIDNLPMDSRFRAAMLSQAFYGDAVQKTLNGESYPGCVEIMLSPNHPCADYVFKILTSLRMVQGDASMGEARFS